MQVDIKQAGINIEKSNIDTLKLWEEIWLKNIELNKNHFSYFNKDHSIKVWLNENQNNPIVLVGAGFSLEKNIDYLSMCIDNKIPIFSCAHSFMYLNDLGIKSDFVCVLDAGSQWAEYLIGESRNIPLFADWCCDPVQLKDWMGAVYFYASRIDKGSETGKKIIN